MTESQGTLWAVPLISGKVSWAAESLIYCCLRNPESNLSWVYTTSPWTKMWSIILFLKDTGTEPGMTSFLSQDVTFPVDSMAIHRSFRLLGELSWARTPDLKQWSWPTWSHSCLPAMAASCCRTMGETVAADEEARWFCRLWWAGEFHASMLLVSCLLCKDARDALFVFVKSRTDCVRRWSNTRLADVSIDL